MSEQENGKGEGLFSKEERRRIVRSFIEAYLRGYVKIVLPTAEEIERSERLYPRLAKKGKALAEEVDLDPAIAIKEVFGEIVEMAAGSKKNAPLEVEEAIDELFGIIISYRAGDRIEGDFFEVPELEKRVQSLERRIGDIEALLEELRLSDRVRRDSNP